MREAWLHRRLLKGGFGGNLPLFVLTEAAFKAGVEAVYGDLDAVKEFAPFPCEEFILEIPVNFAPWRDKWFPEGGPNRVLLLLAKNRRGHFQVMVFSDDERYPKALMFIVGFYFTPDMMIMLAGTNDEQEFEAWRLDDETAKSFGAKLYKFDGVEERRRAYENSAAVAHDWLVAACAVIATPGLPREEGRARGPEPKVRQRGATSKAPEFAYTRISLDIDRTVSGGEKAQEAEARKLALHRVRAHLRFIKDKGLVPVRAHMRGNAAHGVRIGRTLVHKGGN